MQLLNTQVAFKTWKQCFAMKSEVILSPPILALCLFNTSIPSCSYFITTIIVFIGKADCHGWPVLCCCLTLLLSSEHSVKVSFRVLDGCSLLCLACLTSIFAQLIKHASLVDLTDLVASLQHQPFQGSSSDRSCWME